MAAFHRKSPLPRMWLMTDERVDEAALMRALARLPRGAGVVFRHYATPGAERRTLFERVRGVARRRGLVLMLAGSAAQAAAWGADGWHGRALGRGAGAGGGRRMLHSAPAHDLMEMRAAERAGANILFVSPVFPTRSHPGALVLGRVRFGMLARQARRPVAALGGMTRERARGLKGMRCWGWAGIDGWG